MLVLLFLAPILECAESNETVISEAAVVEHSFIRRYLCMFKQSIQQIKNYQVSGLFDVIRSIIRFFLCKIKILCDHLFGSVFNSFRWCYFTYLNINGKINHSMRVFVNYCGSLSSISFKYPFSLLKRIVFFVLSKIGNIFSFVYNLMLLPIRKCNKDVFYSLLRPFRITKRLLFVVSESMFSINESIKSSFSNLSTKTLSFKWMIVIYQKICNLFIIIWLSVHKLISLVIMRPLLYIRYFCIHTYNSSKDFVYHLVKSHIYLINQAKKLFLKSRSMISIPSKLCRFIYRLTIYVVEAFLDFESYLSSVFSSLMNKPSRMFSSFTHHIQSILQFVLFKVWNLIKICRISFLYIYHQIIMVFATSSEFITSIVYKYQNLNLIGSIRIALYFFKLVIRCFILPFRFVFYKIFNFFVIIKTSINYCIQYLSLESFVSLIRFICHKIFNFFLFIFFSVRLFFIDLIRMSLSFVQTFLSYPIRVYLIVSKKLLNFVHFLSSCFRLFYSFVLSLAQNQKENLKSIYRYIFSGKDTFCISIYEFLKKSFSPFRFIYSKIINIFEFIYYGIRNIISCLKDNSSSFFSKFANVIISPFRFIYSKIINVYRFVFYGIHNIISCLKENSLSFFVKFADVITSPFRFMLIRVINAFKLIWYCIFSLFSTIGKVLNSLFRLFNTAILDPIKYIAYKVFNSMMVIVTMFNSILRAIFAIILYIASKLRNLISFIIYIPHVISNSNTHSQIEISIIPSPTPESPIIEFPTPVISIPTIVPTPETSPTIEDTDLYIELTDEQIEEWNKKSKIIEMNLQEVSESIVLISSSNGAFVEKIRSYSARIAQYLKIFARSTASQSHSYQRVESILESSQSSTGVKKRRAPMKQFLGVVIDQFYNSELDKDIDGNWNIDSYQGNYTYRINKPSDVIGLSFNPTLNLPCSPKTFSIVLIDENRAVASIGVKSLNKGEERLQFIRFPAPVHCDRYKIIILDNWGENRKTCFKGSSVYVE